MTVHHFKAAIIDTIGCAQSMAVIKTQLQPFGCKKAVPWLYLFAVQPIVILHHFSTQSYRGV